MLQVTLHSAVFHADACCDLRKVRPLARATAGFNAIITGRKRYQAATRARLKPFEVLDGVLRINPLANWDADDVETWLDENDLPRHPLAKKGYVTMGDWHSTTPAEDGEGEGTRFGGQKYECGLHLDSGSSDFQI